MTGMNLTSLPFAECSIVFLCCLCSCYITVAALMRHGPFSRTNGSRPEPSDACEAISVLKPLCGAEPRLYVNLRTFCEQTHPRFQLFVRRVGGVRSRRRGGQALAA
jgi:ceramide glucosyltransferase